MPPRVLSLPVRIFGERGWSRGILALEGDQLRLELTIIRRWFGFLTIASSLKVFSIRLEDITEARYDRGWWKPTLRVRLRTLEPIADIPGAEAGELVLRCARHDRSIASELSLALLHPEMRF
jgi:hypothetical protein